MMCLKLIKSAFTWKRAGIFAAGAIVGTLGAKLLTSDKAKHVYAGAAAAALRAKDQVMKTAASIQEHAGDVIAEAKQINEDRADIEA